MKMKFVALIVVSLVTSSTNPPAHAQTFCGGDCNMDGFIRVNEIIAAVNIALTGDLALCPAADRRGNGVVNSSDLVAFVNGLIFQRCASDLASMTTLLDNVEIVDLGSAALLRSGALRGNNGGPAVEAPAALELPPGSTIDIPISASQPFDRVFLTIVDAVQEGGQVRVIDYFEFVLSESSTDVTVRPTLIRRTIIPTFDFVFQVGTDNGSVVGEPARTTVQVQ